VAAGQQLLTVSARSDPSPPLACPPPHGPGRRCAWKPCQDGWTTRSRDVLSRGSAEAACPQLVEKARCSEDDYYHKPTPVTAKRTPAAPQTYRKASPGGHKKSQGYAHKPSASGGRRYLVKPSADSYVVKAAPSAHSPPSGYHVSYRPAASADSHAPAASYKPAPSSDSYGKRK